MTDWRMSPYYGQGGMMTARRMATVLACVVAFGVAVAAQDRGKTRAQGKVLDEQGEPLADVIVAAIKEGFDKPFQQATTNNKGEWRIDNLAPGKWKFFFGGKQGLEEKSVDVEVGDSGTVSVPDVKLGKPVDRQAELNTDIQKAAELMQTKQPAEARKIYESILTKYPDMQTQFQAQLNGAIAQTYAAENQAPKAVEYLKKAVELDPQNTDIQLVYGEVLMQVGQKAEAEKVLLAADMTKVKDPFPYMNIVISKINEQKMDEAFALISKLMTQFPNETALYYYRGRANLAAKKMPDAKADLEKFVAGAPPDARELPDAKKILEQMKDIK
jgi:Tfp pilus assembly protein PilF